MWFYCPLSPYHWMLNIEWVYFGFSAGTLLVCTICKMWPLKCDPLPRNNTKKLWSLHAVLLMYMFSKEIRREDLTTTPRQLYLGLVKIKMDCSLSIHLHFSEHICISEYAPSNLVLHPQVSVHSCRGQTKCWFNFHNIDAIRFTHQSKITLHDQGSGQDGRHLISTV